MSFGTKQYQHRFYTTPKIRDRHFVDFIAPHQPVLQHQPVRQLHNPVYAFSPYPQSPLQDQSMKQSYIRLVNNGINSRLYNKDELGYEGVKFEKDVISRYCSDDYAKNTQILQKFKKQAEESRRIQKYRHLRQNSSPNHITITQTKSQDKYQTRHLEKNLMSFLPVTNSGVYHNRSISSPQKLLSIKNTQHLIQSSDKKQFASTPIPYQADNTSRMLPLIKPFNHMNQGIEQGSYRAIYEEDSHNQIQDNRDIPERNGSKFNIKHSIVRDVGINAHLTAQQASQTHKKRNSHQIISKDDKIYHDRKKSESLRVQTMKLKNKHMKKKYEKLKQELMKKSVLLSQHEQLEEERREMGKEEQARQNFKNLQVMIHDLCDKLRENNSKIQQSREKTPSRSSHYESSLIRSKMMEGNEDKREGRQRVILTENRHEKRLDKRSEDQINQTQINILKSSRINGLNRENESNMRGQSSRRQQQRIIQQSSRIKELLRKQQMEENRLRYEQEIQRIESYRDSKPKIVYSINSGQKMVKKDGLRLLKNRIQEKHFHLNFLGDYSTHKHRSKTQFST